MRILKRVDVESSGAGISMMLYGEAGVGKTVSILAGARDPIAYIQIEPRSLAPSLAAANRKNLDIDVFLVESFEELKKLLASSDQLDRYNTIVIDSYSHLMNIMLSSEIENESFEAKSNEERLRKPLISQTKLSVEGFGGLSSQMFRVTELLCRQALHGKHVIVTARLSENPKWNRELQAAPALKGREFPSNMAGFFDLIGLVTSRTNDDGIIIYPPYVQFESDGSFIAKFTGAGKRREGVLNLGKILDNI